MRWEAAGWANSVLSDAATSACVKGIVWDEALQFSSIMAQSKMGRHTLESSHAAISACEKNITGFEALQLSIMMAQNKMQHHRYQRLREGWNLQKALASLQ